MHATPKAPLVVVGAGHVGLVTAVGFAAKREVRVVDRKRELVAGLSTGELPIFEPGLQERLSEALPRMSFHVDIDEALDESVQLVFIAVDTPTKRREPFASRGAYAETDGNGMSGAADLKSVSDVIDSLLARPGLAAVMKSTVPTGTGEEMLDRARAQGSDLIYVSCPEFLQEGSALKAFDCPDRIVVGAEEESWATEALRALHGELHRDSEKRPPYFEMDIRSAETVKYAANLGLATRISYANEVGNFCEQTGADITAVMEAVGADHRIGPEFLRAGPGFGGSCFRKDLLAYSSVAEDVGAEHTLADTVLKINSAQPRRIVQKLLLRFDTLRDTRVAILGLTFKAGTDDLRDSPAIAVIRGLRELGASVRAWDPMPRAREDWGARGEGVIAESALDAMVDADVVVVLTDWPEFRDIDWRAAADVLDGVLVLDGRNCVSASAVRAVGLEFEGTGRESLGLTRPLLEGAAEG